MPRSFRFLSTAALILAVSGCCTVLPPGGAPTLLSLSAGIAPDDHDSEPVLAFDALCNCLRYAGLAWGVGGDVFLPSSGSAQAAHLFARYMLSQQNQFGFYGLGGMVVKRHSYGNNYNSGDFSGGGSGAFQEVSSSETNLGVRIGGGVEYGLESWSPFANVEHWQVGGGGFQVIRVGGRFSVGGD